MKRKGRSETSNNELCLQVCSQTDIVKLRREIKNLLAGISSPEEQAEVATAVLELAGNALQYAGSGSLSVQIEGRTLTVTCEDQGPGILEWDAKKYQVLELNNSLGFGLGVVGRLMDAVRVDTRPGQGTKVVARRRLGVRSGPPPRSTGAALRRIGPRP